MTDNRATFVIGAGLGRTGTHSLQVALMELGYGKAYHMKELFEDNAPSGEWLELASAEREIGAKNKTLALKTAQSLIDLGYTATTDYPACLLYEEFLELRPNAKVILSIRSSSKQWKDSVLETIGAITIPLAKPPFLFSPFFYNFVRTLAPWLWERTNNIAALGTMKFPQESLLDYADALEASYEQWVETVKNTVPPEKLLIHHPKEGYPPLCDFLEIPDKDCPTGDYPHISDTKEFKQLIDTFGVVNALFWPATILFIGALLWTTKRYRRGNKETENVSNKKKSQ